VDRDRGEGMRGTVRCAGIAALLAIEGADIATSWIAAVTRAMGPVPMIFADPRFRPPAYHGAKFDFAAEPRQIVAGTVRDANSRQPLAGVSVIVRMLGGSTLMVDGFAAAKTDAEGHYRLVGLPKPPAGDPDTLRLTGPGARWSSVQLGRPPSADVVGVGGDGPHGPDGVAPARVCDVREPLHPLPLRREVRRRHDGEHGVVRTVPQHVLRHQRPGKRPRRAWSGAGRGFEPDGGAAA